MSYLLSSPSRKIQDEALKILTNSNLTLQSPSKQKAVAIFNYVQESIKFGFTSNFDFASPEQTLSSQRGHCNPQGALFASLCNAAGIPAKQNFVQIPNDVLRGIIDAPLKLLHSYVQVDVDGQIYKLDGYIIQRDLYKNACVKLTEENQDMGYGISQRGSVDWDGNSDCFVQMVDPPEKELGSFDNPVEFLQSDRNFQYVGPVGRFFIGIGSWIFNSRADRIAAAQ